MTERRQLTFGDLSAGVATVSLTIPIGGGRATGSISAAGFGLNRLEAILGLRVIRKAPVVNDVYAPSYGLNGTGTAVGITLAAGTGTSLDAECTVMGR